MRLILDGHVSKECVESIESSCEEALLDGRPVHLILRDITVVDESGYALLRRLAAKGVLLFANGLYITYLLDAIRREAMNGASKDKHG